jgi:hypothetical protein
MLVPPWRGRLMVTPKEKTGETLIDPKLIPGIKGPAIYGCRSPAGGCEGSPEKENGFGRHQFP